MQDDVDNSLEQILDANLTERQVSRSSYEILPDETLQVDIEEQKSPPIQREDSQHTERSIYHRPPSFDSHKKKLNKSENNY